MNSLDSQDPDQIQESVRRLSDLRATPQHRTPWTQTTPFDRAPYDTPLRTPHPSSDADSARPSIDTSLSLDAFQAKYTSEDNSSFTEILDEENERRRQKHAWAWEAERRAGERKAKELEGRERLLLEATGQHQGLIAGRSSLSIEASEDSNVAQATSNEVSPSTSTKSQALVLASKEDQDAELIDVMAPRKDTRSAIIPSWKYKVDSPALIFFSFKSETQQHLS